MPGVGKLSFSIVGGGVILSPGAPTVIVEGKICSVIGDIVQTHGESPHTRPSIVTGSTTVFANGRGLTIQGQSIAECAHQVSTGANTVKAT